MPNRLIKESICTSESIDHLTAFQETFFYRLITQCDDYGRFDARPRVLAAKCFPLKDIREKQMEDALRALTSEELVILYEVDGKPFGLMKAWDKHQQIRAKKPKYPGPDSGNTAGAGGVISSDIKRNHVIADAPVIQSNPIQSESNTSVCVGNSSTCEMKRPNLWEVEAYCTQNGMFDVNPKKFLDYMMMNGWKTGRGIPVEDWQAALRYWASNEDDHRRMVAGHGKAAPHEAAYEQREYSGDELAAMLVDPAEYLRGGESAT